MWPSTFKFVAWALKAYYLQFFCLDLFISEIGKIGKEFGVIGNNGKVSMVSKLVIKWL